MLCEHIERGRERHEGRRDRERERDRGRERETQRERRRRREGGADEIDRGKEGERDLAGISSSKDTNLM